MRPASMQDALEALASMEKGKPYSLRPQDAKRRLADDLAKICRDLAVPPVVIGGLAVNHHGYMRLTADVDILVSKRDAVALYRRLRSALGWKRHAEGFKNTVLGVSVDIKTFPDPADLMTVAVRPLPVPALSELIALKVMSGRARDDADVVELLKRHPSRVQALRRASARRLRTEEARRRLEHLIARAKEERERRRT